MRQLRPRAPLSTPLPHAPRGLEGGWTLCDGKALGKAGPGIAVIVKGGLTQDRPGLACVRAGVARVGEGTPKPQQPHVEAGVPQGQRGEPSAWDAASGPGYPARPATCSRVLGVGGRSQDEKRGSFREGNQIHTQVYAVPRRARTHAHVRALCTCNPGSHWLFQAGPGEGLGRVTSQTRRPSPAPPGAAGGWRHCLCPHVSVLCLTCSLHLQGVSDTVCVLVSLHLCGCSALLTPPQGSPLWAFQGQSSNEAHD